MDTNLNLQHQMQCTSDFKVGGILHVHPLTQCNLSCLHCYSDSSPRGKEIVELKDIFSLMDSVYSLGYNVISVSGGEPFLYKDLRSLLEKAKQLGMQTQLVTNGTLMSSPIAIESMPYVDLVAISIDGDEELHDKIRNRKGAYKKALEGAKIVKDSGTRLGIVSAVTNGSWEKMIEVAELAYTLGASLLQFHPLELTGRAKKEIPDGLNLDDFHRAYIVFNVLQEKYEGVMHVQMDCLHRLIIESSPEICGYLGDNFIPNKTNFVQISNSIIMNERGEIMPFSYGLNNQYHIGKIINKNSEQINDMFDSYFDSKALKFSELLSSSYHSYQKLDCDYDLIIWSEYIVNQSNETNVMEKEYVSQ